MDIPQPLVPKLRDVTTLDAIITLADRYFADAAKRGRVDGLDGLETAMLHGALAYLYGAVTVQKFFDALEDGNEADDDD